MLGFFDILLRPFTLFNSLPLDGDLAAVPSGLLFIRFGFDILPTRSWFSAAFPIPGSPSSTDLPRLEAYDAFYGEFPGDPSFFSLKVLLALLPCKRAAWLSAEFCRKTSLDRPRYLCFGKRSVSENKFRLILIVLSKAYFDSSASSGEIWSGKNFLERDSTIGRASIWSHDGR
jgi:hypothetical protein